METAEQPEKDEPRKITRSANGRDELNLAEFPLTILSRHTSPDDKPRIFEDTIRDRGTGELVTRRLTISPDKQYGLPTPLDDDVIVGLVHITKVTNNFTDPTVPFSRYALIELLGWPYSGQSFRRLDESLNRWLGVTLRYKNAWWDKEAQSWVSEGFHILDNLTLYDKDTISRLRKQRKAGRQKPLPFSSFTWNKVVFRSFQADNLKKLDLSLYFQLSCPAAKRAYRFLDKRFYRSQVLEFDLRDFACEHIGFSRNYTAAKIKEKFQPAIEELEAIGFLEPLTRQERYVKKGRGDWRIVLVRKPSAGPGPAVTLDPLMTPELSLAAEPESETTILEGELIRRKVTAATARELVSSYPLGYIETKIQVFDWLAERKDKRVAKSPAGYLVESCRKDYAPPKGFVSKAERAKREAAEQEKREREAEKRRQERARKVEEAKVGKYWSSLSPEEQSKLEADAMEAASEELRKSYEDSRGGPLESMARMFIREAHIRTLLKLSLPSSE